MHFFSSCSCFHPIKNMSSSPQSPFAESISCDAHGSCRFAEHTSEAGGKRAALRPEHSQKKQPLPANERRDCKISLPCLGARSVTAHKIAAERSPQRCRSIQRKTQIPFPSLAGQTVIVNQAVLLAPVHRSSAPSQVSPVTFSADSLTDTVAGPRRLFRLLY